MILKDLISDNRTRNQDKSGRIRRNDVVNEPDPRPLRVVTATLMVAVS